MDESKPAGSMPRTDTDAPLSDKSPRERGTKTKHETADARADMYLRVIRGTWSDDDPTVLGFPGDGEPIVADVDGELVALTAPDNDPERITRYDLVLELRERSPIVKRLSAFAARCSREDFNVDD